MKKIALLKCPGALNIGNEFINIGGEYVIKKVLNELNIECKFYDFEFFETDQPQYKYRMPWNTDKNKEFISKEIDLIIIFGGSIFSQYLYEFLDEISSLNTKKVILGAGFYAYDIKELNYVKRLLSKYDLISTRDDITYTKLLNENLDNLLDGLDMAFFIEDYYYFYKHEKLNCKIERIDLVKSKLRNKLIDLNFMSKSDKKSKGYCVINIDMLQNNKKIINKLLNKLNKYFENVYIVENTSTLYNFKNFIHLSRWSEFYKIYANAELVITTRIHSSVVCSTFATPFLYLGQDSGGQKGRNTLFNKIDTKLEYGKFYKGNELNNIKNKIKIQRNKYIDQLKIKIKDIFS